MKTLDAWDRIVTAGRQVIAEAQVLDSSATPTGDPLRIVGGTVRADLNALDLAGSDQWPADLTNPLHGFAPGWVSIRVGAIIDTAPQTLEVARLLIDTATLQRQRTAAELRLAHTLTLVGVGTRLGQGTPRTWTPYPSETAQTFLARVVAEASPRWLSVPVVDTSTPYTMPVGYSMAEATPVEVIVDVESLSGIVVHFDHLGRLVMADPNPDPPPPVRTLSVSGDVTGYEVLTGPGGGFANTVEVVYRPTGTRQRERLRGDWNLTVLTSTLGGRKPAAGEMVTGTGKRYRIHYRDNRGKDRRSGLRRVVAGDVVRLVADSGAVEVRQVLDATDLGADAGYLEWQLELITSEGGTPADGDTVEVDAFVPLDRERVVTASQLTGPLGVDTVGAIIHREQRNGDPDQVRAGEYTRTLLEATLARAVTVERCEILPDPRLEPGDPVDLVYATGQTVAHYVTELELPLGTGPQTLALRAYPHPVTQTAARIGG